jgi:mannose-6-phosphate isomerase-like protein (cupin superfamily)
MTDFATKTLPASPDVLAPDGSEVRLLHQVAGGSMAHFTLHPGQIAKAVKHRTVDEMWFIVSGHGQMWRSQNGRTEIVPLGFGTAITIPVGTAFQFRAADDDSLGIVGVTMPPWPGEDEAVFVAGAWTANV